MTIEIEEYRLDPTFSRDFVLEKFSSLRFLIIQNSSHSYEYDE